mgnify:CR=1 FL=1
MAKESYRDNPLLKRVGVQVNYTQEQLDMRRKAEVLQCVGGRKSGKAAAHDSSIIYGNSILRLCCDCYLGHLLIL